MCLVLQIILVLLLVVIVDFASCNKKHSRKDDNIFGQSGSRKSSNNSNKRSDIESSSPTVALSTIKPSVITGVNEKNQTKYPVNITDVYRGTWETSPNTTLGSLAFKNSAGQFVFHLTAKPSSNSEFQIVQVEMVIRDGFFATERDVQTQLEGLYNPQSGSLVLWSFLGDSLVPVQSFTFGHLDVAAEEAKIDHSLSEQLPKQTRLGFATTSFCFLHTRFQVDPVEALEEGESEEYEKAIHVLGLMSSPTCQIHMRLNATAMNYERYFVKAIHYTLMVSLMSFIQMLLLVRQMEYSSSQANAAKISLLTIGQQGVMDSYMCLMHLFAGVFIDALFTAFATTSFFKFIVFSLFEMRFLLLIWKARRPQGFQDGWEQARRELGLLYSRFYGFLLGGVLLFWILQSHVRWLVLILYSFWIPQIVHSAQHGHRKPLVPYYIIGVSLTRLAVPLYVYLCPKNWLHTEPDVGFAIVLILYVFAQAGILLLQHYIGPRFFIPRRCLPRHYDYYRPVPTEMHDMNPTNGNVEIDCVICMSGVIVGSRFAAVTPCDHVFHVTCLQQWMQIKMECPTCRRPIPDFVD